MKRTLKRESKVLEIVKNETIGFSEKISICQLDPSKRFLVDFLLIPFSHYQLSLEMKKIIRKVGKFGDYVSA
jgi:hypothetical protein